MASLLAGVGQLSQLAKLRYRHTRPLPPHNGNTSIDIRDNNLIIGHQEYEGTPGLYELIIGKRPDENIYTHEDLHNYAKILVDTSALKQNNKPEEAVPKSNRGWKWRNILRQIWRERNQYDGEGVSKTVIISSAPDALLDRLELLLSSKSAGKTDSRNEIVSICNELLRQKVTSKPLYKKNYLAYIKKVTYK